MEKGSSINKNENDTILSKDFSEFSGLKKTKLRDISKNKSSLKSKITKSKKEQIDNKSRQIKQEINKDEKSILTKEISNYSESKLKRCKLHDIPIYAPSYVSSINGTKKENIDNLSHLIIEDENEFNSKNNKEYSESVLKRNKINEILSLNSHSFIGSKIDEKKYKESKFEDIKIESQKNCKNDSNMEDREEDRSTNNFQKLIESKSTINLENNKTNKFESKKEDIEPKQSNLRKNIDLKEKNSSFIVIRENTDEKDSSYISNASYFNRKENESKYKKNPSEKSKKIIENKNKEKNLLEILEEENLRYNQDKIKDIVIKSDNNKEKNIISNNDNDLNEIVKKPLKVKSKKSGTKLIEKKKEVEFLLINELQIKLVQESFYANIEKKNEIVKFITETGNFDTRNKEMPFYIILPNSRVKRYWMSLIFFFIIYRIFLIPLDVGWNLECFLEDEGKFLKLSYNFVTILFFFDMLLNFFSAYLDQKNQYVTDIKLICINYLKSNFVYDLIACFPFERMVDFNKNDCFENYLSPSKIFFLINLICIFKIGYFLKLIEEIFARYVNIIRMIKIFFIMIYLSHFFGNIFSGISSIVKENIFKDCYKLIFITKEEEKLCFKNKVREFGFFNIYVYNVLIGIYFLLANEYPTGSKMEKTFTLSVLILSLGLNASIFGNVAVVLSKLSVGLDPFIQEKVDIMKEYMNFMKFEKGFINTIEEYHVNIWMKQRNMMYPEDFFSNLSIALQKLIFLKQWKENFFAESRLLTILSKDFFSDLLPNFKAKIFMKKDIIITEGNSNYSIYLISRNGCCSVKIGGELINVMQSGEYFGEIAVLLRSKRRTATVICEKDSDFLSIEGDDYEKLLQDYPEDYKIIKSTAKKRLMDNVKICPSKLWAKLVPSNEIKDYLIRKCIYLDGEEEDLYFQGKEKKDSKKFDADKVRIHMHYCSEILKNAKKNITYYSKLKNIEQNAD
jgi:hypothetical protein